MIDDGWNWEAYLTEACAVTWTPLALTKRCDYCGDVTKHLDDDTALCFECEALLPSMQKSPAKY